MLYWDLIAKDTSPKTLVEVALGMIWEQFGSENKFIFQMSSTLLSQVQGL